MKRGEFWAELRQLKWPKAVLRDRAKGEELWGGAGALWAVSLGTGMGKQPGYPDCPLSQAAARLCLSSY